VGDDSHFVFRQKLLDEYGSVRRGVVVVKQPGLFLPKLGGTSSHVFTQSPQNGNQFGQLGPVLCATTTAVYMAAQVRNILDTTSYFSLFQNVQTGSRAQPASYSMGTAVLSQG
jgi:hypothetical protein